MSPCNYFHPTALGTHQDSSPVGIYSLMSETRSCDTHMMYAEAVSKRGFPRPHSSQPLCVRTSAVVGIPGQGYSTKVRVQGGYSTKILYRVQGGYSINIPYRVQHRDTL